MDPVKAGLVVSLGRPEGNVTGLATLSEDLWQKRLGLLKEVAPRVSRVALLWNPTNPGNASCVKEIKAAAPALRLQVLDLEVRDATALDSAFATMASESADALVTCMRIGSSAGGAGNVGGVILPTRCQFWFKHGEQYFFSDSDSDRSARIFRRTLKQ